MPLEHQVNPFAGGLRLELHCHSSASFDGKADALRLARVAHERGLTHLAITDHDTIDGALAAQAAPNSPVVIVVGQEMRSIEGDLIGLYIERAIPSGLTLDETAGRVREQGGLVGLAHPFDARRPSVGRGAASPENLRRLAALVDYVEVYNARVRDPAANARAADFAREYGLPQVAVSDSHTESELGGAATIVDGPVGGAAELLAALRRGGSLHVRAGDAATETSSLGRRLQRWRRG